MKKKNKVNIKEKLVVEKILLMIVIALILCIDMKKDMTVHIATDEFGYWVSAANFLGYDWSNCASLNNYYSFGYGLILAPLFLIFENPTTIYKVALGLNVVMILLSFLISYSCFERVLVRISKKQVLLICFVASIYAGNIFYTKLTLTECFLWLLYNVTLWMVQRYCETKKIRFLIIGFTISGFMFMVHMRTLSIACAMFLCLVFIKDNNILKKMKVLFVIVVLLISFFLLEEYIKESLQSLQYLNNGASANDIQGQTGKMRYLFSIDGIKYFISNFSGRLFYLGYSTLLLFFFGVYSSIKKIFVGWEQEKKEQVFFYAFIVLTMFFAICISSLFMINVIRGRTDTLFYGRYSEYVLVPFIVLGIEELHSNKYRYRLICLFGLIQLLLAIFVQNWVVQYEMSGMLDVSIPALYYWVKKNNFEPYVYFSIGLIPIIFSLILGILQRGAYEIKFILSILIIGGWWGYMAHNSYVISDTHKHDEDYLQVYEVVEENSQDVLDVYYCFNETDKENSYYFMGIDRIQFCLKDNRIRFCDIEEIENIAEGSIIIVRNKSGCNEHLKNKEILLENSEFNVYKR